MFVSGFIDQFYIGMIYGYRDGTADGANRYYWDYVKKRLKIILKIWKPLLKL